MAIKYDIQTTFDTLEWSFLLRVLSAFGSTDTFIQWIHLTLLSARLYIKVNGHAQGFFPCGRGGHQGDPLSPLLFCIVEEVLSRGITILVHDNRLPSISSLRGVTAPSPIFMPMS